MQVKLHFLIPLSSVNMETGIPDSIDDVIITTQPENFANADIVWSGTKTIDVTLPAKATVRAGVVDLLSARMDALQLTTDRQKDKLQEKIDAISA